MSLKRQPVSCRALRIGPSSGASIAAQAPVAGSWISAPMLSDKQRKTRISAVIESTPHHQGGSASTLAPGPELRGTVKRFVSGEGGADALVAVFVGEDGEEDAVHAGSI